MSDLEVVAAAVGGTVTLAIVLAWISAAKGWAEGAVSFSLKIIPPARRPEERPEEPQKPEQAPAAGPVPEAAER